MRACAGPAAVQRGPRPISATRGGSGPSGEASTSGSPTYSFGQVYFQPTSRPSTDRTLRMYVVQIGDTIDDVATAYRISRQDIAGFNPRASASALSPGSVLWVPASGPPARAALHRRMPGAGHVPLWPAAAAAAFTALLLVLGPLAQWQERRVEDRRVQEESEMAERRDRMKQQRARVRAALSSSEKARARAWSAEEESGDESAGDREGAEGAGQGEEVEVEVWSSADRADMQRKYQEFIRRSRLDARKLWDVSLLENANPFRK